MNTTYTLSLDQLKELEAVKSRPIDTSDIPELTAGEAEKLHFKYYKPVKEPVQIRIDSDVLQWFKSSGKGYQSRINAALRQVMIESLSEKKAN
ncbi:MAG: BrnA antitoxin family protein [Treponema sp.]|nr:BrnA antitoxin family protein [Treponema sp.]